MSSSQAGKKRKSITSPDSQASISKFFKVTSKSTSKLPNLKLDDPIKAENKKEEKRVQDVVYDEKPSKIVVERNVANIGNDKLSQFERGHTKKKCPGIDIQQNAKMDLPVIEKNPSEFFVCTRNDGETKDQQVTSFKKEKSKHFSDNNCELKPVGCETQLKENQLEQDAKVEEVVDRGILFGEINKLKKKVNFTPLEQQVIAIKKKHMDVLLFVECGYRYRFFGEDAEVASKELDISAYIDKNFITASIPVHRLTVHVSRMVEKGYKVGVVNQTETAALKAAGDNRSAPFTRKLSHVYTKATFVDREENEESSTDLSSGRYIISVAENKPNDGPPYLGVYCINPTSGDIACLNIDIVDNILSKLETVFLALKPSEVLLPQQFSEKNVKEYIKKHCNLEDARFEQVVSAEIETPITEEQLKKKLGADFKCNAIMKCISLMVSYLKQFKLQNLVSSLRNYRPYSMVKNCMHIDGLTLKNLELLENTFDRKTKGSLLWVIDHTRTVFGKRLLKQWVIHPLVKIKGINNRLDAVSQLLEHFESPAIQDIQKNFLGCIDIEKNLTGVFYRKITPEKFIKTMESLSKLNGLFISHAEELSQNFTSSLLKSIFEKIPKLLGTDVDDVLCRLDKEAASKGNKENLFRNVKDYPAIVKARDRIRQLEEALEEHKNKDLRRILGGPVEYKSVSGLEYLVEVKNKEMSKVPKNWVKINSTKQVARFRPLFVEEHYKKLCQQREKLHIAADLAWESCLNDFSDMYDFCRKAVLKFAELDCLLSLATVAKQSDYCRPVFNDSSNNIEIIGGRHPVLSALLPEGQQYVDNDTFLGGEHKAMIVSGPNMGGKSSYIRQVAINCILAQIGSYIPASSASLYALDGVYTRMGSSDNIAKGKSTFMLELEQASMIIREATSRSLVILDELGRGTSTYDGMAIAFATLKFFIEDSKAFTLFVTHYPMLSEFEKLYPENISNHHMAFMSASDDNIEKENVPAVESIIFLYKLIKGAAKKSYGLNVARLAGIPLKILTKAASKSSQMENEVQHRIDNVGTLKSLFNLENSVETLKQIVANA